MKHSYSKDRSGGAEAMIRFRRDLLPAPEMFYRQELVGLGRQSRGWVRSRCPFHHPDRNPSFCVNLASGGFHCFACGVRGGDVVDFVMQRYRMTFKAAVIRLGAVADPMAGRSERAPSRAHGCLVARAAAARLLAEGERELRIEYRGLMHAVEDIAAKMQVELGEQKCGSVDHETCGYVLSMALDQLRRAVAAYYLLAFGSSAERADFVAHPEKREAAIAAVMARGHIRDNRSRIHEVIFS